MTYFYKFVAFPITIVIVFIVYGYFVRSMHTGSVIIATICLIGFLVIAYFYIGSVYFIQYDNQFVYVKGFFREQKFPLRMVKQINEPYYSRDPTFELELEPIKGSSDKFDFFIKISESFDYGLMGEIPESITKFMQLVKQVKETERIMSERNQ